MTETLPSDPEQEILSIINAGNVANFKIRCWTIPPYMKTDSVMGKRPLMFAIIGNASAAARLETPRDAEAQRKKEEETAARLVMANDFYDTLLVRMSPVELYLYTKTMRHQAGMENRKALCDFLDSKLNWFVPSLTPEAQAHKEAAAAARPENPENH